MSVTNIPLFKVFMADTVPDKVKDVLSSGYIGQGPKNEEFESQLRNYYGKSCVTVNSGTSGLSLIYNILDVEEYEHILTTPLTCFATNAPLITQDIPIRWVDVDYNTCQMSINDLRGKIRDTTRAVVLVSWGGYSLPYNDLLQIKDDYRRKYGRELIMIEDAAHSFGNPNLGTLDFTILSLQAIKHVTSVDGGVIIPKDEACVDDLQKLRWYGLSRRKWNDSFRCESDISRAGFKYHMNDVNSVIGMENLKHADWILNRHRRNMMWYDANLLCSHVELPQIDNDSSCWLYTIKVGNRDNFLKFMDDNGVQCSRVHERNDHNSCVKRYGEGLPALDNLVDRMVCIPVGWWLSDDDLVYIKRLIRSGDWL